MQELELLTEFLGKINTKLEHLVVVVVFGAFGRVQSVAHTSFDDVKN